MKIARRAMATLMATLLLGGLLAAAAGPAQAGSQACEELTNRRQLGLVDLCGMPIVFSDAKTGDLFLTDDEGTTPYRLTHTPMVEENPVGLFPWVFYDGTTADGSDIYMLSLLDPGAGRIRITGLHTEDWDPTAISAYNLDAPDQSQAVPADQVGDRAMALGPGGLFYPILLGYSSDRDDNKDKCGIELFAEIVTLTGPERISNCNRTDKTDPEWSYDGDQIAFTGWHWGDNHADVRVMADGDANDHGVAQGLNPTWNPFCCPGKGGAPDTSQPSGDLGVTFTTNDDGKLKNVWYDGTGEEPFFAPGAGNRFVEAEWNMFGYELLSTKMNASKSWIVILGEGGSSPPITSKKKFWVQSADFAAYLV